MFWKWYSISTCTVNHCYGCVRVDFILISSRIFIKCCWHRMTKHRNQTRPSSDKIPNSWHSLLPWKAKGGGHCKWEIPPTKSVGNKTWFCKIWFFWEVDDKFNAQMHKPHACAKRSNENTFLNFNLTGFHSINSYDIICIGNCVYGDNNFYTPNGPKWNENMWIKNFHIMFGTFDPHPTPVQENINRNYFL